MTLLQAVLLFAAGRKVCGIGQILQGSSVRSKDLVPALGRGYSFATGTFSSKCLVTPGITDPSFDYYFRIFEIDVNIDTSKTINSKLEQEGSGDSIGAATIKDDSKKFKRQTETKVNQNMAINWQFTTTLMEVDRYYTSVDETQSSLDKNVVEMLQRSDYIGVVSTCGPSFVRGIRRTAELKSDFQFFSSSAKYSRITQNVIDESIKGLVDNKEKQNNTSTRNRMAAVDGMKITVTGFGLDMTAMENGDSLIAESLEDYDVVMRTAFKMMLNPLAGVIRSIEVVPWDNNLQYQDGLNMNMIVMYQNPEGVTDTYPTFLKQMYFSANAEHIVKLEHISRYKFMMIQTLAQCMQRLWGMSDRLRCKSYVSHQNWVYESSDLESMKDYTQVLNLSQPNAHTLTWNSAEYKVINTDRLKWLLDGNLETGFADGYFLVQRVTTVYQSWLHFYFAPCFTKLSENKYGMTGGMLFTSHWLEHSECNKITCLMEGAEWKDDVNRCSLTQTVTTPWVNLVNGFCMPEIEYVADDMYHSNNEHCNYLEGT
uniref:MACPF domain-containing protein n=1 Tax=Corethron hystrix TaxID=216773 RepID=A0A7S1BGG2_9STRA|mmetsp:Transcript_25621/g.59117  ORF Transcript_25621/g.59117 Transcript_25621/m.59117 type:complete len:540 (+) Transcript_25621:330-1949(+)|eukprot:CAMPEP_0113303454 /NCGR_PEP_ID=MMETSP0010_2-20120614/3868_1 /TAXON_ID=216773 ORGANISM="Corethron hystrix, Strain 308" /NCGR_SAMPLE_ID=MMETSP0010_2 /ASSEMBLY_ACC=CAM_ASM_000155 /LENGTH=539 /DNA_ID=CAMNT_0000157463 /DNA_START=49 /DNA_END=1668 /DNA_ORIENTATION=- /assembly_acc=CAM_ASM_000155